MADTPERRLEEMAKAITQTLYTMGLVLANLPIPIGIGFLGDDEADLDEGMAMVRSLLQEEPIAHAAWSHLDQAVLSILIAMDQLEIAMHNEIEFREDGVYWLCATATANLALADRFLAQEK